MRHNIIHISQNYLKLFVKGATGRQPFTAEAEKVLLFVIDAQRKQCERLQRALEDKK